MRRRRKRSPALPAPSGRTVLYRHFDAAGRLLYVGISLRAITRLGEHHRGSRWAGEIATVTHERFPNRKAAHRAERVAIATEDPVYNVERYGAIAAAFVPDAVDPVVELSVENCFHSPRRLQLFAEGKLKPLDYEKWQNGGYGPYPWGQQVAPAAADPASPAPLSACGARP